MSSEYINKQKVGQEEKTTKTCSNNKLFPYNLSSTRTPSPQLLHPLPNSLLFPGVYNCSLASGKRRVDNKSAEPKCETKAKHEKSKAKLKKTFFTSFP